MIELRYLNGKLQARNVAAVRMTPAGEEVLASAWRDVPRVESLEQELAAMKRRNYKLENELRAVRIRHADALKRNFALRESKNHLGKSAKEWFDIAKKRKAAGNWLAAQWREAAGGVIDLKRALAESQVALGKWRDSAFRRVEGSRMFAERAALWERRCEAAEGVLDAALDALRGEARANVSLGRPSAALDHAYNALIRRRAGLPLVVPTVLPPAQTKD